MTKEVRAARAAARDARIAANVHEKLRMLGSPGASLWLSLLGFLLLSPCIFSGFSLDDYWLLDELARPRAAVYAGRAPFDLFRWIDASNIARLTDGGGLGWWTDHATRAAFMRPLSAWTHALDHALWPDAAAAMHVHNLLWLALLFALTLAAYRRLLTDAWTVGLASAMFALDSAHAAPASWIASRSAVLSAAFAIGSLLCHHRSRSAAVSGARVGWAALALGAFVASLLGAELGLGITGYLLAYALFYEAPHARGRLRALLPYQGVLLAYGAMRARLGYGTALAFGVYIDPVREPSAFLRVLPLRAGLLLSSQLSRFAADLYEAAGGLRPLIACLSLGLLALGVWFVTPVLRADRTSRFFFAGALLATLPPACTLPSDRLLLLIGFGIPPVLAAAIRHSLSAPTARVRFARATQPAARGLRLRVAGAFLLVHLVLDPLLMIPYALLTRALGAANEELAGQLTLPPGDRRSVIIAAVPDSSLLYYMQSIRAARGLPRPDRLYWLASAAGAHFTRLGPNRLRVTHAAGFWDPRFEERSPRRPLAPGDQVALSAMTAEIGEVTPDGRPCRVDFVFREPLESPALAWFSWRDGRLQPFTPPPWAAGSR